MSNVELAREESIAIALPRPVAVSFDRITIRGCGPKEAVSIYYVDFGGTPPEQLGLEAAHFVFVGSEIKTAGGYVCGGVVAPISISRILGNQAAHDA